jgi:transposase
MELPEPWLGTVEASMRLIEQLDAEIDARERELRALGVAHPYIPNLMTIPGVGWVLAYTIASEIGDISRFATPKKLCGYTGLCPRVYQSGGKDRRGSLAKNGPTYLRWALIEAATHAHRHPAFHDHYEATKKRLGKQGGSKVARVEVAVVSATRSGTCSLATKRSIRQAPKGLWSLDDPRCIGLPDAPM